MARRVFDLRQSLYLRRYHLATKEPDVTATLHAPAPAPPSRARSVASWVLAAMAAFSGVIAVSVYAPMDDPFEADAQALIATFGVGMCVLAAVVALVPFRRGERWAWVALWVWPAFFVAQVVAIGHLSPLAFVLVTSVALIAGRPR